jgi:hypothetical protein
MNRDSLLSLIHTEPERAKLLLKVASGGALALVLWAWAGREVTGQFVFLLVNLAAIAAYCATLIALTGTLVRRADQWQVDSALHTRRLLSSGRHAETGPNEPAVVTFDHWYFVLRLEDEIKRARRVGSQVSVVILKVGTPGEPTAAMTEQINFDMAQMAANHAKTMTMPSAIGPQEYAFLLPDTDKTEAKARVAPLLAPLGDYWCDFGIAVYPDDGTAAEGLVMLAHDRVTQEN